MTTPWNPIFSAEVRWEVTGNSVGDRLASITTSHCREPLQRRSLSVLEAIGLFIAGLLAGMVNSLAGGGSFITFPALMAVGISPIAANATNTFASCAGYISGAVGFRRELWAHRQQLPRIALTALIGGVIGASLLIQTSSATFSHAIPWLLLLATSLLVWGDAVQAYLRQKFAHRQSLSRLAVVVTGLLLLLVCIYGGFFNAGLGIILLGYFTLAGHQDIHLMNGLKLMVSALVSIVAILVFDAGELIAWREGTIILVGTLIGGYAAASAVRVVSQRLVRGAIILVAAGITVYFFIAS